MICAMLQYKRIGVKVYPYNLLLYKKGKVKTFPRRGSWGTGCYGGQTPIGGNT